MKFKPICDNKHKPYKSGNAYKSRKSKGGQRSQARSVSRYYSAGQIGRAEERRDGHRAGTDQGAKSAEAPPSVTGGAATSGAAGGDMAGYGY